jgi:hypothetical protein
MPVDAPSATGGARHGRVHYAGPSEIRAPHAAAPAVLLALRSSRSRNSTSRCGGFSQYLREAPTGDTAAVAGKLPPARDGNG